jgi:hypothetical protein
MSQPFGATAINNRGPVEYSGQEGTLLRLLQNAVLELQTKFAAHLIAAPMHTAATTAPKTDTADALSGTYTITVMGA